MQIKLKTDFQKIYRDKFKKDLMICRPRCITRLFFFTAPYRMFNRIYVCK